MGKYITNESVLIRLRNKVKTTTCPDQEPDRLPVALLTRLVLEAEGQVEMDLSERYESPFQAMDCSPFSALPDTTQNILRTLCELLGVIRVLETDFGKGSGINADAYTKISQDRYDKLIVKLLSRRSKDDPFTPFIYPPLPQLKTNYHMRQVDTGFYGYVARSDDGGHGGFPVKQINDPEQTFWNGAIDDDDPSFTGKF